MILDMAAKQGSRFFLCALACALLWTTGGAQETARTHLLLIGGGNRPPQALERFVRWSGGGAARILVIPWASEDADSLPDFTRELAPFHPGRIQAAAPAAEMSKRKREFLSQLGAASGVFFLGGDQNRIMDVLKDGEILDALKRRYAQGAAFAGTSAGTAIMSPIMITGEGDFTVLDGSKVQTRPGLGLLPGAIVDQHFLRKERENRLFGLLLLHPDLLGVGVDQDTALAVEDGRSAQVLGPMPVMMIRTYGASRLDIDILRSNERYDLLKKERIK